MENMLSEKIKRLICPLFLFCNRLLNLNVKPKGPAVCNVKLRRDPPMMPSNELHMALSTLSAVNSDPPNGRKVNRVKM